MSWSGEKGFSGIPGITNQTNQNLAINLLIKVMVDGYREGNNLVGLDGWVIPVELKWEIENFLEEVDE